MANQANQRCYYEKTVGRRGREGKHLGHTRSLLEIGIQVFVLLLLDHEQTRYRDASKRERKGRVITELDS
jgi:hypothetical protein